jgi:hypothetical protein
MDLVCGATDAIRKLGEIRTEPVCSFVTALFDRPTVVDYRGVRKLI